ncbi:MAG TPA: hypothetical protein VMG59_06920 [Phycisphaerae bacterium]|nr:hypothetical protein [Phycisphaerae bacterium]
MALLFALSLHFARLRRISPICAVSRQAKRQAVIAGFLRPGLGGGGRQVIRARPQRYGGLWFTLRRLPARQIVQGRAGVGKPYVRVNAKG